MFNGDNVNWQTYYCEGNTRTGTHLAALVWQFDTIRPLRLNDILPITAYLGIGFDLPLADSVLIPNPHRFAWTNRMA